MNLLTEASLLALAKSIYYLTDLHTCIHNDDYSYETKEIENHLKLNQNLTRNQFEL